MQMPPQFAAQGLLFLFPLSADEKSRKLLEIYHYTFILKHRFLL